MALCSPSFSFARRAAAGNGVGQGSSCSAGCSAEQEGGISAPISTIDSVRISARETGSIPGKGLGIGGPLRGQQRQASFQLCNPEKVPGTWYARKAAHSLRL